MNAISNTLAGNNIAALVTTKRPRPVIRQVKEQDLSWSPAAKELFSIDSDGQVVRAGESFAVTRPGWERWPLGIVSDHYRVTDHNTTKRQIIEGAGELVTFGRAIQAGHGYHVVHSFDIRHQQASSVAGAPVKSRLLVDHDHTGVGALRAAMVIYVGPDPIGAVVRARALHVALQPSIWASEIDGMIEKSILAQDCILDILRAAQARVLTDTDRAWIESKDIVSKKGKEATTLFECMQAWFKGNTKPEKMTWGVWERRLDDMAIRVMCELLGLAQYGTPLDSVLGGTRYGRGKK